MKKKTRPQEGLEHWQQNIQSLCSEITENQRQNSVVILLIKQFKLQEYKIEKPNHPLPTNRTTTTTSEL